MPRVTRRQFLQTAAAAGVAGPLVLTAPLRAAPGERIVLGFIGVGTMGRGHLGSFLGRKETQVVAVCDVVAERRADAQKRVEDHYAKPVLIVGDHDLGTEDYEVQRLK